MEKEIILDMKDVSKTFPGVKALQHVDFKLRKGAITQNFLITTSALVLHKTPSIISPGGAEAAK